MRFLLGHSDLRKRVENGSAFDFQFSREIVNSNLTHPTFLFPALGLHRNLTESTCCTRILSSWRARAMLFGCFLSRTFGLLLGILFTTRGSSHAVCTSSGFHSRFRRALFSGNFAVS